MKLKYEVTFTIKEYSKDLLRIPPMNFEKILQDLSRAAQKAIQAEESVNHYSLEVKRVAIESDACEVCKGRKGGVPGNENIILTPKGQVIMCDYCSLSYDQFKSFIENDPEQ